MKDRTRKICSALLTLTLFVGILLPMGATPVEAKDDDPGIRSENPAGFWYTVTGDGTLHINRFPNGWVSSNGGVVEIPSVIDGKTVTELDKDLYVNDITQVTVPGTIAEIPDYLFRVDNSGNEDLIKVVLKDGVEKIGR